MVDRRHDKNVTSIVRKSVAKRVGPRAEGVREVSSHL